MRALKVKDLVAFLQKQDQDLPVVFRFYSEFALLSTKEIDIKELAPPRLDGWVANARDNNGPHRKYLVLPGN